LSEDEDNVVEVINYLKGKKSYILGTLMLLTSLEKYFTGDHTISQYLTTVQGMFGANGIAIITLRAAIAKLDL